MKLVSIIIPTYEGTEHILKSVDSAMMQDYPNIEVIVVDDNGDGTQAQVETEKQLDKYMNCSRFCYIKHDINRNGSAARNTGARYARGVYLNFLDDDDCLGPGKIPYQVRQLENLPFEYGISYSSRVIKHEGRFIKNIIAEKSGDILFEYMMNIVTMGTASVLMRREIWDELQGYDESYVRYQDREFFARILDKYKAVAAPDVWFERNYTFDSTAKTPKIL
jgi:glycosyltransferase involved in cell wall biosynthesis